jgi:hypothetical protein
MNKKPTYARVSYNDTIPLPEEELNAAQKNRNDMSSSSGSDSNSSSSSIGQNKLETIATFGKTK